MRTESTCPTGMPTPASETWLMKHCWRRVERQVARELDRRPCRRARDRLLVDRRGVGLRRVEPEHRFVKAGEARVPVVLDDARLPRGRGGLVDPLRVLRARSGAAHREIDGRRQVRAPALDRRLVGVVEVAGDDHVAREIALARARTHGAAQVLVDEVGDVLDVDVRRRRPAGRRPCPAVGPDVGDERARGDRTGGLEPVNRPAVDLHVVDDGRAVLRVGARRASPSSRRANWRFVLTRKTTRTLPPTGVRPA